MTSGPTGRRRDEPEQRGAFRRELHLAANRGDALQHQQARAELRRKRWNFPPKDRKAEGRWMHLAASLIAVVDMHMKRQMLAKPAPPAFSSASQRLSTGRREELRRGARDEASPARGHRIGCPLCEESRTSSENARQALRTNNAALPQLHPRTRAQDRVEVSVPIAP